MWFSFTLTFALGLLVAGEKRKEEGVERYKLADNKCKLEIKQVLLPAEG